MKKVLTGILSVFLLMFYIGIIMYIFFAVLHIDTLANFEFALVFEIIGFLLLGGLILTNIFSKNINVGAFAPLVMVTVIYTIILDMINIVCIMVIPYVFLILFNVMLLFIYCLVSIPIYILGKR